MTDTQADLTERATKEQSHLQFYNAFHAWFMQGGCDFWNECDAPESLATIAVEIQDAFAQSEREAAAAEARRALETISHLARKPDGGRTADEMSNDLRSIADTCRRALASPPGG